jgi:hypothetical protein
MAVPSATVVTFQENNDLEHQFLSSIQDNFKKSFSKVRASAVSVSNCQFALKLLILFDDGWRGFCQSLGITKVHLLIWCSNL